MNCEIIICLLNDISLESGTLNPYFREPWSLLLYHDRFSELREEMKELFGQSNQPGEQSLREKVGSVGEH